MKTRSPVMRRLLVPRSLAARTALVLLCGLVVVQAVGLGIHALDRIEFARQIIERETGSEVGGIYRALADTDPANRDAELARLHLPGGFHAALGPQPILGKLRPAPNAIQRALRHRLLLLPMPARLRPSQVIVANNYIPRLPPGEPDIEFPPGLPPGPPPGPPPGSPDGLPAPDTRPGQPAAGNSMAWRGPHPADGPMEAAPSAE
ncbi:MAG: hypothetical protein INR65_04985, partial [Gluconacetobacter diazotrophicus]|nr:hypothetical protein [Gluconacetobacter diazotrophicus]